ncbi:MAG: hypothetical protein GC160_29355 [Acidobacteria bacterium]|nr:hypothetical protein [Acidobacteriota bacterium]
MLNVTRAADRYNLKTDWLNARWHFSFDRYHDPKRMGFGPLRVFNHDVVQPAQGFPLHPHRDMEIVTYVINGELAHTDSTGGKGKIRAGEVQRMSAGSGVFHSEFNASPDQTVELLQMWVFPEKRGVAPSYEQKQFTLEDRTGRWLPIVSSREGEWDNGEGSLWIGQDAQFYVARVEPGQSLERELSEGRKAYLFVIAGEPTLNGEPLHRNDSVEVEAVSKLTVEAGAEPVELLMIELP